MTDTYTVAEWETSPYTAYDKRGDVVEHRVRLIHYDRNVTDVVRERRDPHSAAQSGWVEVEIYEMRPYGFWTDSLGQ
jgi:hypothetical protein